VTRIQPVRADCFHIPLPIAAIDHASYLEVHGFGLERFSTDPLVISDGLALVPDRPGHGV
jgi:L-alanine-DL-glutamate epimerase-like enolase superfamily enzyme